MCVAAAVAVAVAVWSWLREPGVGPESAVSTSQSTPAVDPARQEAAIALARMPDEDPWAYAEKVAASSPEAAKPTCGEDQAPAYDDAQTRDAPLVMTQSKPAGPDFIAASHRIDRALRLSADPFDRAVADALNIDNVLTPEGRRDVLVQDATNTADPRVYQLAFAVCAGAASPDSACSQLSARQWASLDPGNGIPWMRLLDQATAAADASGVQEALAHLAAARRFDERLSLAAGAIATTVVDDEDAYAAAMRLMIQANGLVAAGMPAFHNLTDACAGTAVNDANRAQQCQAISDVLFDHSDSFMTRAIGGVVSLLVTGDSSRREIAHAEHAVFSAHWSPATGFTPCGADRDFIKTMLRNAQIGELEAARERSRTFVTP